MLTPRTRTFIKELEFNDEIVNVNSGYGLVYFQFCNLPYSSYLWIIPLKSFTSPFEIKPGILICN